MMKRYLSSAAIGLVVTLSLLFAMQTLIESGNAAIVEPRERGRLTFVRIERNEEIRERDNKPERITEPVDPPATPDNRPPNETGTAINIGYTPPAPPPGETGTQILLWSDGPLVSVIRVMPAYPTDLAQRGVEGHVVVRFDVTAEGTVANVRVIESSHRGFEKNAIRAAMKFRYKPRVVDGVPVATSNVGYRFRFDMEE